MNIHCHRYFLLWVLLTASILVFSACAPKIAPEKEALPEPAPAPEELFQRAEALFEESAYREAMALFNEYVSRFPGSPMADAALFRMGEIHLALDNYTSARAIFERLLHAYPSSRRVPAARLKILSCLFFEGQYEAAVAFFKDMDLKPLSDDQVKQAHLLAGDAQWVIGQIPEAALHFSKAYLLAPDAERKEIRTKMAEAFQLMSPLQIAAIVGDVELEPIRDVLKELAGRFAYHRSRLGCLLPLSGRYADYGQRALRGVELALSRFGDMGDTADYRIIIKDSGGDPEQASREMRDLVETHHVAAVIGSIITAETAALEAQSMGVPIITMTQKEHITRIGDYVFRNFSTPEMQVQTLVTYCAGRLGLNRFAVLYPDEPYGRRFMNLFWDEVVQAGGRIVGVEAYDPSVTDFADPIKKLTGLYYEIPEDLKELLAPPEGETPFPRSGFDAMLMGPGGGAATPLPLAHEPSKSVDVSKEREPIVDFDAVFIPDAPKKAGLIIPQLAFHDVRDTYLLGTNLWYSGDLIDMARQYVQDAIIPVGFFPESESNGVKPFVDSFRAVYGETPGFIEAISHDTAAILLETIRRSDVQNRDDIKNILLHSANFAGVTGPTAFEGDGDTIKQMLLIRIRDREFVELKNTAFRMETGNR